MLTKLINLSLGRSGLVLAATLALVLAGLFSARRIPLDAVPDITSPQVQVNVSAPSLAPEEVEALITVPLERELTGLPGLVEQRSLSKPGFAQLTLTFTDTTDSSRIRQMVAERLARLSGELPLGVRPSLAPASTGLGEIVYYTLEYKDGTGTDSAGLAELQRLNERVVKPALRTTQGLADVNAIGGHERQVIVEPDPVRLAAAGISLSQLAEIVESATRNAGGGSVEMGGEAVVIRANTRVRTLSEIGRLPVKFGAGAEPLRVADLAQVRLGYAYRTGASTTDGHETVTGAAIMLAGGNSRAVASAVVAKLHQIETKLPEKVKLRIQYSRSDLVETTITTVRDNLAEGALLVAAILFAMLGNWRAALIVTLGIPLAFLFMLGGMASLDQSANLMSLGALDFGLIVDAGVVMVENILRHLSDRRRLLGRPLTDEERLEAIRASSKEVSRPMFFGVLIITLVYVPILALSGIEGKMFAPMAIAVMLALAGSLLAALTTMPVLCARFLREGEAEGEGAAARIARRLYAPMLGFALHRKWVVVSIAALLVAVSAWAYRHLGAEFIPQLDEGAIALQMIRGNSVGLDASVDLQERTEQLLLKRFPEIRSIFSRIGTAEIAMDPMGPNTSDTYLMLAPKSEWREHEGQRINKEELIDLMQDELNKSIPGQAYLFTQPVQLRFNEIMAGSRADLSLKLFGNDSAELEELAEKARDILREIPGGADVEFDALGRLPSLEIQPDQERLARAGFSPADINDGIAAAVAGMPAGSLPDGALPIPVQVRLAEHLRSDPEALGALPLQSTADPSRVRPLSDLGRIQVVDIIGSITREDGRRRVAIMINVRGRDTEGFVEEATRALRSRLKLPEGCSFEFGGQFENLQAARLRLAWVVPAALLLILLLIHASFGCFRQALLVFTCIPLAATGGVAALWIRGMPFTIPAAIGFIALSGIAVLNGIMLVSYINQLRHGGLALRQAILEGTLTRLRPKLMTALVASLGFIPMALSSGPGAEVQRPLATVVIGGILSSSFLTLLLLPALYEWLENRSVKTSSRKVSGN